MLIEYSASNVNKENNSGMILDDIFNYQLEIIRKYFGILIDMEIGSKCEYEICYQHLWLSNPPIDVILDHFNQKLLQQKVLQNPKQ